METETRSFEEVLSELEKLAQELERSDVALADAISKFERGVALSAYLKSRLEEAEGRIQKLTKENKLESFLDPGESES